MPEATIHRLDDPDAFDDETGEDADAALAALWARYVDGRDIVTIDGVAASSSA